ncbi:MAG: hypothetical protein ACOH2J_20005 [Allorhizobium sp.]
MLTPVLSISNSQISYQEQRPPHTRETPYPASAQQPLPVAPPGVDQNSVIAGKLSLLLLSGQERMSANLIVLADLIGRALGIQRRDSETNASFSGRLSEALANLTPAEAARVQRQLSQVFSGIQLRMITEAFRNPAGPDAAKLSVFLELARYKDRDLAARTVVTSYRQYSGEPRIMATGLPSVVFLREEPAALPLPVAAKERPADPMPAPFADNSEQGEDPVKMPVGLVPKPGTAIVVAGQLSVMPNDVLETLAAQQVEQNDAADEVPTQTDEIFGEAPDDATADSDIRILQDRLRRNFEDGHQTGFAERSANGASDGKMDSLKTLAVAPEATDAETAEGDETVDGQAAPTSRLANAGEDRSAAKALETAVSKALQMLPATEVVGEIPEEALPERASAATTPLPSAEEHTQAGQTPAHADTARDAAMPIAANADDMTPAEAEAAPASADEAERNRHGHELAARPLVLPEAELALMRQGVIPQGLPLPFINYLISPEYDMGSANDDAGHRFDEGSEGEEEAGEDEFADSEDDSDEHPLEDVAEDSGKEVDVDAQVVMLGDSPVLAITAEKVATDADRVTDLYGRMAVWA